MVQNSVSITITALSVRLKKRQANHTRILWCYKEGWQPIQTGLEKEGEWEPERTIPHTAGWWPYLKECQIFVKEFIAIFVVNVVEIGMGIFLVPGIYNQERGCSGEEEQTTFSKRCLRFSPTLVTISASAPLELRGHLFNVEWGVH